MNIIHTAGRLTSLPGTVTAAVHAVPEQATELAHDVRRLVRDAFELMDRIRELVGTVDAVVQRADHVVQQIAVTNGEARVQVDRVRTLLDGVRDELPEVVELIHPALRNLAQIGPEMGDIAERMDNVGQIVEGLPGSKLLRRRGAQREPME